MIKEEITKEWPILGSFTTLKKASWDKSKNEYMTESTIDVVDFDKIPQKFSKGKGWAGVPKSVDALYIDLPSWTFIEFKNGSVDKCDIHRKIYDSILMLLELNIMPDMNFVRQNVKYILVCKEDPSVAVQKSPHQEKFKAYMEDRSQSEVVRFELKKLRDYLLAEVHTYSPDEFEAKFVSQYTTPISMDT